MDPRPIGVFDSGLGGLTAAKTLEALLPSENLIYFGDSRNAPYGTRTRSQLAVLATANASFLRSFDCKAILVACGTVSSNVMDVLAERFPGLPFFGVIDAACDRAVELAAHGRIAVAPYVREDLCRGLLRLVRKRRPRIELGYAGVSGVYYAYHADAPPARRDGGCHPPIMHFTQHSAAGSPFSSALPLR